MRVGAQNSSAVKEEKERRMDGPILVLYGTLSTD